MQSELNTTLLIIPSIVSSDDIESSSMLLDSSLHRALTAAIKHRPSTHYSNKNHPSKLPPNIVLEIQTHNSLRRLARLSPVAFLSNEDYCFLYRDKLSKLWLLNYCVI